MLLAMDSVSLKFSDEALTAIAKLAMERQTGARGLRSILVKFITNQSISIFILKNLLIFFLNYQSRKNCYWTLCLKFLAPMSELYSLLKIVLKD